VALGGYGRGELSPLSDVDVMFLFPSKTKPADAKPLQEHLTNEILYPLWDCGLKVGHSTRTIDEAFVEARKDIQTKTALLESRRSPARRNSTTTSPRPTAATYASENPKDYIAARLDDQASRRAKYGNTVFNQEPDIKNGVGGLRDYQNAVWMARVKLGITSIDELADAEVTCRPTTSPPSNRAYDFLLRVRNELHFMSARATDVMTSSQPRIAEASATPSPTMLERVETFMQDYYRAAQTIFRVSKLVEAASRSASAATATATNAPSARSLLARATSAPSASTASCCAAASWPRRSPACSGRTRSASSASSGTASSSKRPRLPPRGADPHVAAAAHPRGATQPTPA
jgi:[protein-PII] uridylyltransferase